MPTKHARVPCSTLYCWLTRGIIYLFLLLMETDCILLAEQQDDNDDYCSSCGGNGNLICCDGCTRSFHLNCLDPLMPDPMPAEWFCNVCLSNRQPPQSPAYRGPFALLLENLDAKNSSAFRLPDDVRDYFEGVKTGPEGEYEEIGQGPAPKPVRYVFFLCPECCGQEVHANMSGVNVGKRRMRKTKLLISSSKGILITTRSFAITATRPHRMIGRLFHAACVACGGILTVSTRHWQIRPHRDRGVALVTLMIFWPRFPALWGRRIGTGRSRAPRSSDQPSAEVS